MVVIRMRISGGSCPSCTGWLCRQSRHGVRIPGECKSSDRVQLYHYQVSFTTGYEPYDEGVAGGKREIIKPDHVAADKSRMQII